MSTIAQGVRVRVTLALRDPAAPYTPLGRQASLNLPLYCVDVAKNGGESFEESSTRTESRPPTIAYIGFSGV